MAVRSEIRHRAATRPPRDRKRTSTHRGRIQCKVCLRHRDDFHAKVVEDDLRQRSHPPRVPVLCYKAAEHRRSLFKTGRTQPNSCRMCVAMHYAVDRLLNKRVGVPPLRERQGWVVAIGARQAKLPRTLSRLRVFDNTWAFNENCHGPPQESHSSHSKGRNTAMPERNTCNRHTKTYSL
eukprot:695620-Rhodomonas_salina.2